ncbi:MAG: hypothetical protein ACYC2H_09955 [Thermoplasmatota archaeon]
MTFGIGKDESVGVLGMKGTGKTTLCKVLAKEMGPTAAWDPFGQYERPVQSYRPKAIDRDEFDCLASHLWDLGVKGRPSTLLVEEAEQVLPEGPDLPPAYKRHFLMGRNLELRSIINTRRYQALSKHVMRGLDWLVIMKLEGGDIDYLCKPACLGRAVAPQLDAMRTWTKDPRQGGGLFYTYHDGELLGPFRLNPKTGAVAKAGHRGSDGARSGHTDH